MVSRLEAIAALTGAGQEYEIVPCESWGRSCRMFKHTPENLRQLFESSRSEETFIVYGDERYTFDETQRRVARIANMLVSQYGICKGDRVAISMRNYPEWIMAFNAATSIGAIAVAMNSLWQSEEMEFALKDCGAKVLFADAERIERFLPVKANLDVEVIAVRVNEVPAGEFRKFDDLLKDEMDEQLPNISIEPGDPATILYTSGSTGHPKGAVSSHLNILSALMSWELDARIAQFISGEPAPVLPYQASTLLAVPLFHATGSHAVMLMSYRNQRKIVSMYRWDVVEAMHLIESEQISSFVAPAAMTGDLLNASVDTEIDLGSLLTVGGGGAPRAPEQVKNIAGKFVNALPNTGWGMTETNAIGTGIGGLDYVEHPSSSGRVSALLDLRVVDEEGIELGNGKRGELQVRGVSIIEGYWERPEANAQAFDGEWLRTGDVAYIDEDGYLYIVDRIKDLVIRGGENIGCAEVEAGLLEHPQVFEASVYSVPDERLGEEVGATLYCSGFSDEAALRDFLDETMARFKIPRYITFSHDPLPRIASGKINKRAIREAFIRRMSAETG